MQSKTDQIRNKWAAGDKMGALAIAARFFDRSDETKLFKKAHGAAQNPRFYKQIKQDPEAIIAQGLAALAKKFKLD